MILPPNVGVSGFDLLGHDGVHATPGEEPEEGAELQDQEQGVEQEEDELLEVAGQNPGELDDGFDGTGDVRHEVVDYRPEDQQENQEANVAAQPESSPRLEAPVGLGFQTSEYRLGPEAVVSRPFLRSQVVDLTQNLQREGD